MPTDLRPALLIAAALLSGPALAQPPARPLLLAQAQLSAEDIFWQTIQASTEAAMFQAYLNQVSAGRFTGTYKALAEIKLATLKGAPPGPAGPSGRAVILDGTTISPPPPAAPPPPVAPPVMAPPVPASAPAAPRLPQAQIADSPDIDACDRSAAAPADKEKPAAMPGVTYGTIDSGAAIRACRKAIELPDAPRRVYFQLARAIRKSGNSADAAAFYRKAVELGHPGAMHDLAGLILAGGQGIKRDPGLAMALYERAVTAGVSESLVQLGAMYAEGRGTRRDYARAIDYYQRAIETRTPGAYTNMGVLHANGRGVPRDRNKACEYWREGSALGDEVAAKNLRSSCRMR